MAPQTVAYSAKAADTAETCISMQRETIAEVDDVALDLCDSSDVSLLTGNGCNPDAGVARDLVMSSALFTVMRSGRVGACRTP